MINVKKLKEYMNRSAVESFAALAEDLGEDPAELRALLTAGDLPVSLAERIAKAIEIPADDMGAVFFARSEGAELSRSEDSVRIPELHGSANLDYYQVEGLRGENNALDDLHVAWELSGCYPEEIPAQLQEAVAAAEKAIPADQDAATMHGFALGVQFAAAAMKQGGALWDLLRQELGL
jgi:hypothetical protein